MSLDGLVAQVGQLLGDARGLYGPAPQGAGWGSTGALSAGRDGIGQAGGVLAGWGGAGASGQAAASGGRVLALDNMIGADDATGSGLQQSGDAARSGRAGMDTVVSDTGRGVAAIAPSTDTPAGKRALVDHLQSQLDRAKNLLTVSEQRNVMLAAMIRNGAAGYGGAPARMGAMGMGGRMPMMGGMGAAGGMPTGLGGGSLIPNLAALSRLGHPHRAGVSPFSSTSGHHVAGGGPLAQMAVKAALSRLGAPYVWGAKGPDAFDCSGLTRWAWAQAGVTLGSDTYSQIKQGSEVAGNDIQPGDLVFSEFDGRGPGHVQMVVEPPSAGGGGKVVEAQQSGVPVKISPMPSGHVVVKRVG
ncbi:hypothetical protein MAHJHV34_49790 [Mycobacterium avium subsp. hominissuis]